MKHPMVEVPSWLIPTTVFALFAFFSLAGYEAWRADDLQDKLKEQVTDYRNLKEYADRGNKEFDDLAKDAEKLEKKYNACRKAQAKN